MANKDIRLFFIGDSFVNGVCDEEYLGWVGRLCGQSRQPGVELTCYNLGVRGNSTEDIAARWETECRLRVNEDAMNKLVFSYGVNDTVILNGERRVSEVNSIDISRRILTSASSRYDVVFIGPPPIDDTEQNLTIAGIDQSLARLCNELAIPYLSVFEYLISNNVWMREVHSNDGAHPGAASYQLMADYIYEWDEWKHFCRGQVHN